MKHIIIPNANPTQFSSVSASTSQCVPYSLSCPFNLTLKTDRVPAVEFELKSRALYRLICTLRAPGPRRGHQGIIYLTYAIGDEPDPLRGHQGPKFLLSSAMHCHCRRLLPASKWVSSVSAESIFIRYKERYAREFLGSYTYR